MEADVTRPHGYYEELERRLRDGHASMEALYGLHVAPTWNDAADAINELRKELAETAARYTEQCDLTREVRANVDVYREEIAALRARVAALEPRP